MQGPRWSGRYGKQWKEYERKTAYMGKGGRLVAANPQDGVARVGYAGMNYLSVCSGIEAATVAWYSLGWTDVVWAEVLKRNRRSA